MVPRPVANNQYQAPMIDQPPAPVPDGHLEVDAPRTGEPSRRGHHQQSGPRVSPHCRRAGPPRSARPSRRCTRACCSGSARTRPSGIPAAAPRPPPATSAKPGVLTVCVLRTQISSSLELQVRWLLRSSLDAGRSGVAADPRPRVTGCASTPSIFALLVRSSAPVNRARTITSPHVRTATATVCS